MWDGGFHVRYDGEIEVYHPAIQPTRHAEFYRYQARNRVWLARRNLPLPVGVLYVLAWAGVSALRLRSRTALMETLRGYRIGLTEPGGRAAAVELADDLAHDTRRASTGNLVTVIAG